MDLANAKQPVARCLQCMNPNQVGMVQHLAHAVFMLGLLQELLFLRPADGHDLEGILLGIGTPPDVQDAAVRAAAQGPEDLEFADLFDFTHGSRWSIVLGRWSVVSYNMLRISDHGQRTKSSRSWSTSKR